MLVGRRHDEPGGVAVAAQVAAGAAGQLPAGVDGPADDAGDVVEGQLEDVVQHERCALGRGESLQHHRQREADRVVEGDAVGGVDGGGGGDAVEHCRAIVAVVEWFLALAPGRAKLIQAQAADHGDQPRPHVVDLVEVGAGQSDERLLDDVLGLTEVAEHAQRDVEDVTAVLPPRSPERRLEFAWLVAVHEEMTIGRPAM